MCLIPRDTLTYKTALLAGESVWTAVTCRNTHRSALWYYQTCPVQLKSCLFPSFLSSELKTSYRKCVVLIEKDLNVIQQQMLLLFQWMPLRAVWLFQRSQIACWHLSPNTRSRKDLVSVTLMQWCECLIHTNKHESVLCSCTDSVYCFTDYSLEKSCTVLTLKS